MTEKMPDLLPCPICKGYCTTEVILEPNEQTESGFLKSVRCTRADKPAGDASEALRECEEYFDQRADADMDQDGYLPNEEMSMLINIRAALAEQSKLYDAIYDMANNNQFADILKKHASVIKRAKERRGS